MQTKPSRTLSPESNKYLPRVDRVVMVMSSNHQYRDIVPLVIAGWHRIGIKAKVYYVGEIIPPELAGKVELMPPIQGVADDITVGIMRLLLPGIQSGARNVMVSDGTMFPIASTYWSKTGGHDSESFVIMRAKDGDQHSVLWNCASPEVWRRVMGLGDASKKGIVDKIMSWGEHGEWHGEINETAGDTLNVHGIDEALFNYHLKRFDKESIVYANKGDDVYISSLTADNNFLISTIPSSVSDKIVVEHDDFKHYDIVAVTPDNDLDRFHDYVSIMTRLLKGYIVSMAMDRRLAEDSACWPTNCLVVDPKINRNSF